MPCKMHQVRIWHPASSPLSANPLATDVNSFPARIRSAPKRVSKILLTAGTNDEPPVRKTISMSLGFTADELRRESTQPAISSSSSEIHFSKEARFTVASRSMNQSEKRNVDTSFTDKSDLVFCTERCNWYPRSSLIRCIKAAIFSGSSACACVLFSMSITSLVLSRDK
jgi:hypothetical protein